MHIRWVFHCILIVIAALHSIGPLKYQNWIYKNKQHTVTKVCRLKEYDT